ncbi:MAG: flagellar basal body P-ring formation protein FlgA [Candidatus Schekmanbacteria bacterium]|nr:flagellar basal body P-ring formation protein FlgA [Candidatus Schekmanbacteria bacterium]
MVRKALRRVPAAAAAVAVAVAVAAIGMAMEVAAQVDESAVEESAPAAARPAAPELSAGVVEVASLGWIGAGKVARVVLRDGVRVATPEISLGQIAELEATDPAIAERLDGLDLGHAPGPGLVRAVNSESVVLAMRKVGLPLDKIEIGGAETVKIERKSQTVPRDWTSARVKAFLTKKFGKEAVAGLDRRGEEEAGTPGAATSGGGENRDLVRLRELQCPRDVMLPAGVLALNVALRGGESAAAQRKSGPVVLELEYSIDGLIARREHAQVRLERLGPILKLRRRIDRGEPVGAADVEVAYGDLARVPAGAVATVAAIGQRVATGVLQPGHTLVDSMLAAPRTVERGEMIKAVYVDGALTIALQVQAQQSGSVGDLIRAINPASGKVLAVKITGEKNGLIDLSL